MKHIFIVLAGVSACAPVQAQLLFNNAAKAGLQLEGLRTRERAGGGHYSEVQQGNQVCGFRSSIVNGAKDRVADDFNVSIPGWHLTGATFFMYQGEANSVSINGGVFEIRRKLFGFPGPVVAKGQFTSAEFTDMYRIFNRMATDSRRIQKVHVTFNTLLVPGSYFMVWSANGGGLPLTGPWQPYLTVQGSQTVPSANALQSTNGGLSWYNVQDGLKNQDFPFYLTGEVLMDDNSGRTTGR